MLRMLCLLLGTALVLAACAPLAAPAPVHPSATPEPIPTPTIVHSRVPYPSQPSGVPFPDTTWPEGEWPQGVDRSLVDRAVEVALAGGTAERVRAVVIVHRGRLIYEKYSPNPEDGPGRIMPSFSMAKSFTSALLGVMVRRAELDVYAPVPVPQWASPGDQRGNIIIDDLLRMTSGLNWNPSRWPDPASDTARMLASDDAVAYVVGKRYRYPAGSQFAYSDGNAVLLAGIMADRVGRGYAFKDFMRRELLEKIGIHRMDLRMDPSGNWFASVSADTTARDFVKLGLLFLRDGIWKGEPILPEGWVDYCRTPTPANPEYGAGWWLDIERPNVFYAIGVDGQAMTVDLEHDLTFVTLATDSAISLPLSEAILDAFSAAN